MQTRNDSPKKKKKDIKWCQLNFSLNYDHCLLKTHTDCSENIHHTENRDLRIFNSSIKCVTSQFKHLTLYMYFLPLKMIEYDSKQGIELQVSLMKSFYLLYKKEV